MRQRGIRALFILACVVVATPNVNAQSNLLSRNFDESAGDGYLMLNLEETDVSPIREGTIFDPKTLNFKGDVLADGGALSLTYRFGKNFMGFEGSFGGAATNFDSRLFAGGMGGGGRLSYRDSAMLSYRIGRFVAPNVAVYGMVGTSMSQLGGFVSAEGSGQTANSFPDEPTDQGALPELAAPFVSDATAISSSDNGSFDDGDWSQSGNSGRRDMCSYKSSTYSQSSYSAFAASAAATPAATAVSAPAPAAAKAPSAAASAPASSGTIPVAVTEYAYSGSTGEYSQLSGVMIGAGLEMLLGDSVHVRAEYRYIDFGSLHDSVDISSASANFLPDGVPTGALFDLDRSFHSAQISVFYKF